jgi:hypothetical protein
VPRKKRKGGGEGNNTTPQGIKLPKVETVRLNDKYWEKYDFTMDTACHVISDPIEVDGKPQLEHVFYINMDNNSLGTEMKYSKQDPRLLEAKFKYGNVLLGLAMLHEDANNGSNNKLSKDDRDRQSVSIQDQIRKVSEAVAPVLLPMIDQLAGLNENDIEELSMIGDVT